MIDIAAASDSISQFQAWELWFQNVDISNKSLVFGISVRNWGRIGKCMQAFAALTVLLDIIGAPAVRRFGGWLRGITTLAKAKYLTVTGLQLLADIFVHGLPDVLFRLDNVIRNMRKLIVSVITCCSPGTKREKRLAIILRSYRRIIPAILSSKKGLRRKTRWRARVFPPGVKVQQFQEKFILPVIYVVSALLAIYLFYNDYRAGFAEGVLYALYRLVLSFFLFALMFVLTLTLIRIIISIILVALALFAFGIDAVLIEPTAWVIGHPKNENFIKGVSIIIFLTGFYFDLLAS